MFYLYIFIGKIIIWVSKLTNLGGGSTWPGHVVLKLEPNFLSKITKDAKQKIVVVAGTNGKTTTSSMVVKILQDSGKTVFQNNGGANLENGLVSSFISHMSLSGEMSYEYVVLEVDENVLPLILKKIKPHALVILNLFRDQLDRYGELDSIASKWSTAFKDLTSETSLFLNADDPLIASLSRNIDAKVYFFGLEEKTTNKIHQHASDSIYCPVCRTKLTYTEIYYSHLGHWYCDSCKFSRSQPDLSEIPCSLPGRYNKYNALAAGLFALKENIPLKEIEKVMANMTAVFGRQEKIVYNGRNIQIFLSKNPTSFNQSLTAIVSDIKLKNYSILYALNDDIPDGRDISWIWDVDFEDYSSNFSNVVVSGYRAYDLALRLQYSEQEYKVLESKYKVESNLKEAIDYALEKTQIGETLYILPTYSAMLDIRKILTGKKIL